MPSNTHPPVMQQTSPQMDTSSDRDMDMDMDMDPTPSVPEPSISSPMPSQSHLRPETSTGILLDRTESFDTAAELEIKLKNRSKSRSRTRNRVRMNSTPVQISHARDSRIHTPTADGDEGASLAENERMWAAHEKKGTGSPLPVTPAANPNPNGDSEKPPRASSLNSTPTKENKMPEEPREHHKPIWRKGLDKFSTAFWSNRHVAWIYPKTKDWNEMKPVIRCAVAAWIGFIFLLIYPVEQAMGQAAFFALIVAFIAPPNLPFIQAMEQIFFLFFFVGLAWGWVVLAGLCVNRARTGNFSQGRLQANQEKYAYLQQTDPTQYNRRIIFEGSYIEAAPAIICAAFLGVGCAFYAWLKIHTQPAPFTFALVLGCVLMDVSLTIMHLFPYSYLTSGLLFMLPMSIQLGLAVVCSVFVFPESVGSSFTRKLDGVLKPIMSATDDLKNLFNDVKQSREQRMELDRSDSDPTVYGSEAASFDDEQAKADKKRENLKEWAKTGACIREKFINSGAGLGPLKGQEHYLGKELAFSRYSGTDIQELFVPIQNVQLRSAGLSFFFDVLSSAIQHTHLDSQAFNVNESRPATPTSSRPPSLHEERRSSKHVVSPLADDHFDRETSTPLGSPNEFVDSDDQHLAAPDLSSHRSHSYSLRKRLHLPDWHRSPGTHSFPRSLSFTDKTASHTSLMDHLRKNQAPVGIFESMKYLEMERSQGGDVDHVTQEMELLAVAVEPLIEQLKASLSTASTWLSKANKDRSLYKAALSIVNSQAIKSKSATEREEHRDSMKLLEKRLGEFRTHDRFKIIEPYRHLLDPSHPPSEQFDYKKLKHRALFWGFLFSYHISEFSAAVLEVLDKQEALDELRPKASFWWPRIPMNFKYFTRKQAAGGDESEDVNDDTDPDHALNDESEPLLGQAKRRDPDTMPFDSPLLNGLRYIDRGLAFFSKPEFLFAVKAGLLTVAVAAPAYVPNSAGFWYYNRALWCLVMAQLTLAVNSGDTIAAFLQRLQASFWGCLTGLVLWYISSGSGTGNRYGLGAVTAVAFVPLMTLRVLWGPGTPLVVILYTVSAGLVIGYSWINTSLFQATDVTYGWSTAWRRFVTVVIGTTAAMIVSQLPPVQSGKRQIRLSYSRTISQIGNVLCDVLSEMHDPHGQTESATRDKVLALKRKLTKLGARHATIGFEVSLRGNWPAARYQALQDVCVDLVGLLSQLNHVTVNMPYIWKRAVLQRTRLSDSQFIGDLLAVISMCASALKSGTPLPQITPGPLVERLYSQGYGLEVVSGRWDEDGSLPKHVTVDVLESDEYLRYAISTTCIFSIVRRFDRLLLVLKTIVGEEFHLDHLDMMERHAV